jgi:DNA-directed RNA polymerase subunit K/omega
MAFFPVEKMTRVIPNKYEAVLVAAKDARVQNNIARLKNLDPNLPQMKVTTRSLYRLIDGQVHFFYINEERSAQAAPAASESEVLDLDTESKADA